MIIEALTAFSAVKITWEMLEILHLVRVGHETAIDACRGGNSFINFRQKKLQEMAYKKDPLLRFVHEAKTDYDFQATGDAEKAFQKVSKRAQTYLDLLNKSLGILNNAKRYFLETHRSLEKMVNALKAKEEQEFSSQLSKFGSNLKSFKDAFNQFSLKIKPPVRKNLYIADISKGTNSIGEFNAYLKSIDACFRELKETKEKMAILFESDFRVSEASSSSALSFEKLKQRISGCMAEPELIEETMQKVLPKNSELAGLCTEIAQISTAFKKNDNTDNEQTNLWSDDPNWLPLLTKEKQIETGQRIFLHAMNDTNYPGKEKSKIAQIFLRQHVFEHELNQVTIDLLSQELANSLIVEQIKKCGKFIQFLSKLTQGRSSRAHDPYGLLEWLKRTRHIENSVECLIKLLVSPYCLGQYHIESLQPKLEILLPRENTEALIKKYRASHWGTIREKSDQLIQLPASFKTKIIMNDRFQKDDQSEESNIVSSVMSKLSEALIIDIKTLEAALYEKKAGLDANIVELRDQEKAARDKKENLAHENGVGRIKESHRYIASIDHPSNNLYPYLYHPKTINEAEKERQVPTVDDLLQVIYRGVDLHGICKCKGNPDSRSNLLLDYFYPEQENDSRMEAFVYASRECQVNAWPLFQLFSYPTQPLLAIENGKNPSLVIILRNTKKISVPAHSIALNNISPKAKEETETFIKQLDDYYNLSFMRLRPGLRNELALVEKFKLLFQGLFNLGQEIREERFESVQIIIGKLHAIVSAEDIKSINQAIDDLKKSYEERIKQAKSIYNSTLYTVMQKAMNGCILDMRCLSEAEQKQLKLEEEKSQFKEEVETLKETVETVQQENKDLQDQLEKTETQLKESEEQRVKDKEAMEKQRVKDKEAMEAQMKELRELINLHKPQQAASSSVESDADMPKSSNNAHFFRP